MWAQVVNNAILAILIVLVIWVFAWCAVSVNSDTEEPIFKISVGEQQDE